MDTLEDKKQNQDIKEKKSTWKDTKKMAQHQKIPTEDSTGATEVPLTAMEDLLRSSQRPSVQAMQPYLPVSSGNLATEDWNNEFHRFQIRKEKHQIFHLVCDGQHWNTGMPYKEQGRATKPSVVHRMTSEDQNSKVCSRSFSWMEYFVGKIIGE